MLGPFATTSRLTPIQQMSLALLSRAACASMSTMTTTTRDREDRYGPMEWAQSTVHLCVCVSLLSYATQHRIVVIIFRLNLRMNIIA